MTTEEKTEKNLKKAMDIMGNKWSALILYYLHKKGPSRFVDCQKAKGINPRTLTQRLASLEEAGLISKKIYNEYPPRSEYSLTAAGTSLMPVINGMIEWAKKDHWHGRDGND